MYSREHTLARPQQLTPRGSEVERALAKYKEGMSPPAPYFTTGYVDGCPSLKVIVSEPNLHEVIVFKHPYASVEEIYPLAEQSQVGTVKTTLYRQDARKSREFANIEVLDDTWRDTVTSVCGQVKKVLAPGATRVNADLYKLLIYRKGDFFNCHQDAQHSARMFATLLFLLPVKYTGGEFNIYEPRNSYRGENVIEDKQEPDGCSWVAFYTDVRHRVCEVKEGFRVVLNYCLSFEGELSPSCFLPSMGQSAAGIVHDYFITYSKKALALPLLYEYTRATLSPEFLKGIDACIFNAFDVIKIANPELYFVLRFDKTRVIPGEDFEHDHEQVFQGVFLVKHETAKKYFEIQTEYERLLDEADTHESNEKSSLREKRDSEYLALMKEVKASQEDLDLEWIVEREFGSGNPKIDWGAIDLRFEHGQLGWLGNMTPAEEYYYIRAAIVVRGKK